MKKLAEEIIAGRRLNRGDDLSIFLSADLDELCRGADLIRKELCGDKIDLCTIINGRSGRCPENCKFCAQSCHHHTNIDEYPFLDQEHIVSECMQNEAGGVHRFSIVTAGRSLKGEELDQAIAAYERMHRESKLTLCASHGLQTEEEFRRMKDAGVDHFHANIETSRRYFPSVCTTHTYEDKIENIKRARRAGLGICSGGIIGMGESWEDRLDMALSLAELEVQSIPINILRPIPGTPYADMPPITEDDVLRTVAFFRYLNPTAWIRMAAGRNLFPDGGAVLFRSGANAALTGDMLTTTGTSIRSDKEMLSRLGFQV
ncbi:MAG: biotin synthase BioB [Butyricicoccaceae bacterium]